MSFSKFDGSSDRKDDNRSNCGDRHGELDDRIHDDDQNFEFETWKLVCVPNTFYTNKMYIFNISSNNSRRARYDLSHL